MDDARTRVELALIAAIADEPDRVEFAAGRLSASDFLLPAHRDAFELIVHLRESGKPVNDPGVLLSEMAQRGIAGEDGTQISPGDFREAMLDCLPTNVPEYCEQIIRWSVSDCHRKIAKEIVDDCNDPGTDALDAVGSAIRKLEDLSERTVRRSKNLQEYSELAVEGLKAELTKKRLRGIPTGITEIDKSAGGLVPGELIIVAARPGYGKTSLAVQFMRNAASMNLRSLFYSLEMNGVEVALRTLCSDSGVTMKTVRSGQLGEYDIQRMEKAVSGPEGRNDRVEIVYDPEATVREIRSAAKVMKDKEGLHLLAVDYLSIIRQADPNEFKAQAVGKITRALREIAQDLMIPVVALAQLNRNAGDERPTMSHIRDSGEVEQAADLILLINRPDLAKDDSEDGRDKPSPELIIAKARQSSTGVIPVGWSGKEWKFVDSFKTPDPDPSVDDVAF